MNNPIATYRVQFHKGFTLADLDQTIPYLQKLGISTIYASPVFEATPGSTHGYDSLDSHRINPEIGTEEQLIALAKKLKTLGIKWLQDIVPNHMAFDTRNPWIMHLLEKGERSVYAHYFDIDWNSPLHDGKLMVPFLGNTLEQAVDNSELQLTLKDGRLTFNYFEAFYPLQLQSYLSVFANSENAAIKRLLKELKNIESEADDAKYRERFHSFHLKFQKAINKKTVAAELKKMLAAANNNKAHLKELAGTQHYRLCHWQETDERINFRRFFTVNGLICLNIQHPDVLANHHSLIRSMVEQRIWQGLRIDHIDGLYDPTAYLQQLRQITGGDTYIVVEKILEEGEKMPSYWDIQGSSGYDFLSLINNLFTYSSAEKTFTTFYNELIQDEATAHQQINPKKSHILYEHMQGELDNLYQLLLQLNLLNDEVSIDKALMKKAIGGFLIHCPVYRYYASLFPLVNEEEKAIRNILQGIKKSEPALEEGVLLLQEIFLEKPLTGDEDYKGRALQFYMRCMQFTGPLMAKGVEDTLMYTYNRFIGHNEVGDSPEAFGISMEAFHAAMVDRQSRWPLSLNGTSTHDTKRGEDVRARLNVLTEMGDEWIAAVTTWRKMNEPLTLQQASNVNDEYFIYQTLIGAYPMPGMDEDNFTSRIQEYIQKSMREAKTHTNWTTPNETYENATNGFAVGLLNQSNPFWKHFKELHETVADFGIINSLAQVLLKFTCPGTPDVYQGAELWDLSLVDPDNRRAVDYKKRQQTLLEIDNTETSPAMLQELWQKRFTGEIKLWLTATLFNERRRRADVFAKGNYIPLAVEGKHKQHVFAFARHHHNYMYVVAVPIHLYTLSRQQNAEWNQVDWEDTHIVLPTGAPGDWHNILLHTKGKTHEHLPVQNLFSPLPFAIIHLHQPNERGAGVLLHISSLASPFAIGDLGPEAKNYADFLTRSSQKYWQLLPLNPTEQGQGHSPYSALCSMAGNPLLISPEMLVWDGLLSMEFLHQYIQPQEGKTMYAVAEAIKTEIFEQAYQNYREQKPTHLQNEFDDFCHVEANWLDDFALYMVLKKHHQGKPWYQWDAPYKQRNADALERIMNYEYYEYSKVKWLQFIFFRQWRKLKKYCNKRDINFIGDMPFYISYDSSDVWSNRALFAIDEEGTMTGMAGVPPDAFSDDGQLWGMPVFNWNVIKETNYKWWIERLRKNVEMCDIVRLDHFRAFADYWEVPAGETTAKNGTWKQGPGADFFTAVKKAFGDLPFVAEDLGDINDAVLQLRDDFNLPGMKILQFAFSENMPKSDHIPHQYVQNFIAYTGTHDNNTIRGWYRELDAAGKERLNQYTGRNLQEDDVPWVMARMAYGSVARIVILPVQDVLGLDEIARMNLPGSAENNWGWRLLPAQINDDAEQQLKDWTWLFDRE